MVGKSKKKNSFGNASRLKEFSYGLDFRAVQIFFPTNHSARITELTCLGFKNKLFP